MLHLRYVLQFQKIINTQCIASLLPNVPQLIMQSSSALLEHYYLCNNASTFCRSDNKTSLENLAHKAIVCWVLDIDNAAGNINRMLGFRHRQCSYLELS
uniref:Uncharacterized protein n=1 Tax=Aegilops tauschii subsp. strangulata TaxID=200361 RepID=A0A453S2A4_AEGTS